MDGSPSFPRSTRTSSTENYPRNSREARDYLANLKRRERNQESRDDLAALEAELRRAYVTKELQAQIAEKEAAKCVERIRERQLVESMRIQEELEAEANLRRKFESVKRSEEYRHSLDEQLTKKKEEEEILLKEARIERRVLEEADEIREVNDRLRKLEEKEETMKTMLEEKMIQEEMRKIREAEEEEIEEKKRRDDLEYSREIDERIERAKKLREEYIRSRERVLREVASLIVDVEARRIEREELLDDLIAEEIKYELLLREEEEETRRRRMKEELAAGLEEQIVFAEQCKARFAERDATFAEEVMRKVMEDERMAKLTTEARRRCRLQYRQSLLRLIEERRRIREREASRMKEEIEEEYKLDKMKADEIAEERKTLLMRHASAVSDFVRREVLTAEELEICNSFQKSKGGVTKNDNVEKKH